jgi:hypothetical protein
MTAAEWPNLYVPPMGYVDCMARRIQVGVRLEGDDAQVLRRAMADGVAPLSSCGKLPLVTTGPDVAVSSQGQVS